MNLLNYTLKYLAVIFLFVLGIWASIFYLNMLDEIYDSMDDGLENTKMLIINKVEENPSLLYEKQHFFGNYFVKEISKSEALKIKDSYKDSSVYMLSEEDFEPVRILNTAFETGGKYYSLSISTSMVEEEDLIEDLFYALIWLYVTLLLVIVFVNKIVLQKLWKPFYQILKELKKYKPGQSFDLGEIDAKVGEFKELKAVVHALLERNSLVYNQQKQFIENASHELQTPLAISINKLEILAEKNVDKEADINEITEILEVLGRIVRLNKSLLQLSKIENRQFQEDTEISLNEIVQQQKVNFTDFPNYKRISISIIEKAERKVMMNADLANVLIANLLKNAIIHNVENGTVEILIQDNFLQISNSGKTEALDADKIFTRFYKNSTNEKNTGLGLAIAKAITDLYGFSILYYFKDKHHIKVEFY